MPSNQQRREAAKRKLQRQLTRRAERARTQRQRLTIVGVVAAVLVIAGGVWFVTTRSSNTADGAQTGAGATDTAASTGPSTPCSYPASRTPAKPVTAPTNLSPANTGTVDATLKLNVGDVPLELDRAEAPCAVESFLSLASQNYFSDTTCHRLTTASTLKVLQCGDPTGTGTGGPGYSFADELNPQATYAKGVLAMANSGPDSNGSQFFLVYGDSQLQPNYTVFGKISDPGLSVLDAIAAKGTIGGGSDGKPKEAVTIESVTIPSGAVDATGSYTTASASDSGAESATGVESTAPATGESAPAAGSTGSAAPATGETSSAASPAAASTGSATPNSSAATGANGSTSAATTTQ